MRLFVAVDIDSGVQQKIADFCDELRQRAKALAPRARIAWARTDQLHVTVRFVGEVEAAQGTAIAAALRPELAIESFNMIARGAGAFPPSGAPRVFWAGIANGSGELSAIEQEVSGRLAACGVEREGRPYRPHLTLARVRDAAGLRSAPLFEALSGRGFGVTRVDAITLFESRTSPRGATYESLQRTPLRRRYVGRTLDTSPAR